MIVFSPQAWGELEGNIIKLTLLSPITSGFGDIQVNDIVLLGWGGCQG